MSELPAAVKQCLLGQSNIAGIGNIYSDEILYTAGIYPERMANGLKKNDWELLAAVILERLSYFIEVHKMIPEEYLESKRQDTAIHRFCRFTGTRTIHARSVGIRFAV